MNEFIIGEFKDTIIYPDGREVVLPVQRNTILLNFYKLIASLIKGDPLNGAPIKYWAIGDGLAEWDPKNPPAGQPVDTRLAHEIGRKIINPSDIVYLTDLGEVSPTPTNIIKVEVTFEANECTGSWMEFGIVGGNATGTANSGTFINHKTHPLISKEADTVIRREIRFSFNKGGVGYVVAG